MMTVAMYLAVVLFAVSPRSAADDVAARGVDVVAGYIIQMTLINPFIGRQEHSQFHCDARVAVIIVDGLLIVFGPDDAQRPGNPTL